MPRVPERMRGKLDFELLYDAFGGKLAHWNDYITDYGGFRTLSHASVNLLHDISVHIILVNSNGTLDSMPVPLLRDFLFDTNGALQSSRARISFRPTLY